MTVFEKITESPEVLAKFLACLPVVEGPWDDRFHDQFCSGCDAKNCDACPHAVERNNPGWWLNLESGDGCVDRYAAIVTYHNGAVTGAVVEAESQGAAWRKLFTMFKPEIIASAAVSMVLTPERGGHGEAGK